MAEIYNTGTLKYWIGKFFFYKEVFGRNIDKGALQYWSEEASGLN